MPEMTDHTYISLSTSAHHVPRDMIVSAHPWVVREPPVDGRVSSMFSTEELMTDNAMVSIYPYGDQLYALTETPYLFRINPETLETENRVRHGSWTFPFTA